MGTDDCETLSIRYVYEFQDGQVEELQVTLDGRSLELLEVQQRSPEWARLDNEKCPNCPLSRENHAYCPAALAVANLPGNFENRDSVTPVKVTVHTEARVVRKDTTLASALFPLLGLRMATSGCPILGKLRPMARFHLPFADSDETVYRAISMYLVSQLLRTNLGRSARFDLEPLKEIYEQIHQVNLAFGRRLHKASLSDAGVNSLTTLDMFAQDVPFSIETALSHLHTIFAPYLAGDH